MPVNVNLQKLEVTVTGTGHLSYCGHVIHISDEAALRVWCTSCGKTEALHGTPEGLHRWESILYLLGQYPDSCDDDAEDLEQRISDTLDKYVGKPADQARLAAIENDIRKIVGDDVVVNVIPP